MPITSRRPPDIAVEECVEGGLKCCAGCLRFQKGVRYIKIKDDSSNGHVKDERPER